ncbi:hypothetical protein [Brevibacillus reuszeri]|uniref:hypothetical protein n=1 Tax=Brevibacillus reuszeri TaxID=54915 RepID=UPI0028A04851|nr:hypothetical protein [Brevibacillus reuszeri]
MEPTKMHQQLVELGLERIHHAITSTYRLSIICEETGAVYPLLVNTVTYEQGHHIINFEEAEFADNKNVPLPIQKAALDKLIELEQQLCEWSQMTLEGAQNSSMAQNMDEMKKLGDEMKDLKTGSEIIDKNQIPDPIQ